MSAAHTFPSTLPPRLRKARGHVRTTRQREKEIALHDRMTEQLNMGSTAIWQTISSRTMMAVFLAVKDHLEKSGQADVKDFFEFACFNNKHIRQQFLNGTEEYAGGPSTVEAQAGIHTMLMFDALVYLGVDGKILEQACLKKDVDTLIKLVRSTDMSKTNLIRRDNELRLDLVQ